MRMLRTQDLQYHEACDTCQRSEVRRRMGGVKMVALAARAGTRARNMIINFSTTTFKDNTLELIKLPTYLYLMI